MMKIKTRKGIEKRVQALLHNRSQSMERTRVKLHYALDRFEHGTLANLPGGTRLTVRSLAVEAGVSKDTVVSRYLAGDKKDQLRYPEILERMRGLKDKQLKHSIPKIVKKRSADEEVGRLRRNMHEINELNVLQARRINDLDSENQRLRRDIEDYKKKIAMLDRDKGKMIVLHSNKDSVNKP